jgi:hypothetical protein
MLWADDFDSVLLLWTLEWGYHGVTTPAGLWDANSFFPHHHTLVFSDSLLGAQIFYTPLRLLGVPPLWSTYTTLALVCLLGVVLSDLALQRIARFTSIERGLILVPAHFGLFMVSFLYHYQLFGFQLAPPFLLFLFLTLRRLQPIDIFLCALTGAGAVSISTYLVPMLTTLGVVALGLLGPRTSAPNRPSLHEVVERPSIFLALVVSLSIGGALWQLQLRHYHAFRDSTEQQQFSETRTYSAHALSLVHPEVRASLWYPDSAVEYGDWERGIFPGWTLLCATGFLLLGLLGSSGFRRTLRAEHELAALLRYSSVIGIICVVLACGPLTASGHWLPFAYVAQIIPGLESIRAPGRFGMLLGLSLGVCAVALVRCAALWLLPSISQRARIVGGTLLTLAIAAESIVVHPVFAPPKENPSLHLQIQKLALHTPTIILPVAGSDHISTLRQITAQLWESRHHWAHLVVGYGARSTPELAELISLDQQLHTTADLAPAIRFARRIGVRALFIELTKYPDILQQQLAAAAAELQDPSIQISEKDSILHINLQTAVKGDQNGAGAQKRTGF